MRNKAVFLFISLNQGIYIAAHLIIRIATSQGKAKKLQLALRVILESAVLIVKQFHKARIRLDIVYFRQRFCNHIFGDTFS